MKKIVYFSFIFLLIISSVLCLLNYTDFAETLPFNNLIKVSVTAPDETTNSQAATDIISTAKSLNTDILYYRYNSDNTRTVYKTNNLENFLEIEISSDTQRLKSNQCISTEKEIIGYNVISLYTSPFCTPTTIYPMNVNSLIDFTCNEFCVYNYFAEDFVVKLSELGYIAEVNTLPLYLSDEPYPLNDFCVCPILIFIFALIAYFVEKGKTHILLRMQGYSPLHLMKMDICVFLLPFFLLLVIVQVLQFLLFALSEPKIIDNYFSYVMASNYYIYMIVVMSAICIIPIISLTHNKYTYIKGKNSNRIMLVLTLVIKSIAVVMICIPLINIFNLLPPAINSYKTINATVEKTNGYISFSSNNYFSNNNKGYIDFYEETKNKYEGVFLYALNYNADAENIIETEKNNGLQPCEPFNSVEAMIYTSLNSITVNTNYFNLNPIYKTNGELVSKKDFFEDKINILISENEKYSKDFINNLKYRLKTLTSEKFEINIIKYKPNQKFVIFQNTSSQLNDGYADDPLITVIDGMYLRISHDIISAFNKNNYIIKVKAKDPYKEILPILKKCGLENEITDYTSPIKDIQESLDNILKYLNELSVKIVIYLLLFVFNLLFFVKTYLIQNKNDIAVRKMSGEGFFTLHNSFFTYSLFSNIISITVTVLILINSGQEGFKIVYLIVPVIVWIAEIIIFRIYVCRLTSKIIIKILKGS
ncbi:MAG: DUF1430 domain-containing protein [Ruminococcus sp.]|nr:DUF1430 domain-containing protein [Ruminococcus sp.]